VALALLLPVAALAQEKAESPRLPLNPYAEAKPGAWEALVCRTTAADSTRTTAFLYRVASVDGDKVTVERASIEPEPKKMALEVSRTEAPTIVSFLGVAGAEAAELKTESEKKTVAGRAFACEKLSVTLTLHTAGGDGKTSRIVAWFSKEVPGSGLVALTSESTIHRKDHPDESYRIETEVAGFGASADVADWGKLPREIQVPPPARSHSARVAAAKAQILALETALDLYEVDNARYPDKLEDLVEKPAGLESWRGPYLKRAVPKDPWGHDYVYTPPAAGKADFTIVSYGSDGAPGGTGDAADITNHEDK
jgi:general secretion pathway protein G